MNKVNSEFFGKDPKVLKALNTVRKLMNETIPLMIIGEIGVGKQSLGHWMHEQSNRAESPCLTVDCSRSEKIVENDILGYRDEASGKFHKGVLERSNGGTVILKNIDGLTENFQKKLHRIIQELKDYDIDVRIIVTTTKNISKLVGAGRFYRALYLHISQTQVFMPPLRERKEDIRSLTEIWLQKLSIEANRPLPTLSPDTWEKMLNYYWANNILELKNVLQSTFLNLNSPTIEVIDLTLGEKRSSDRAFDLDEDGLKLMSLKEAEKLLIKKALIHTSENRTQAAKILGVSIRTLRNKINEYRNDGSNYFINLR